MLSPCALSFKTCIGHKLKSLLKRIYISRIYVLINMYKNLSYHELNDYIYLFVTLFYVKRFAVVVCIALHFHSLLC